MDPVVDLMLVAEGDGYVEYKIVASATLELDLFLHTRVFMNAYVDPEGTARYREKQLHRVFLSKGSDESEVIRIEGVQDTYAIYLRSGESYDDPNEWARSPYDEIKIINRPDDYSFGTPTQERFGQYHKGIKKLRNFDVEKVDTIKVGE